MAEQLVNEFTVNRPIDEAWAVITDVERIAPCLPGAQLQEVEGETYRGVVKIKLGSITPQFKGQANFLQRDDAAVGLAFDLLELRAGQARGDALDVGDHRPGFVDGPVDGELVDELFCHVRRSSAVSMSIGEPSHGTSVTRSGRRRIRVRAPSSPPAARRSHVSSASRTG